MATTAATTTPAPRRSNRVDTAAAISDGDTWHERLAVCESATTEGRPKLQVRSYYRNARTQERVWDEPPSGAARICHATPEQRQRSEQQKLDLQSTLNMIPVDHEVPDGSFGEKRKKKKGGLFKNVFKKKDKKQVDDAKDLNLQKAIALSMQTAACGGNDNPVVLFDHNDDDDLDMAKALSLSEVGSGISDCKPHAKPALNEITATMSEETMLQRALEESRLEAQRNGVVA